MLIDHIIQTRQFTTIAAHDDGGQRINFKFLLLSWKHISQSRPLTIWSNLFLFYSPLLSIKSIFCVFVAKVLLLFNSASRSSDVTNWLPIGEFSFLTQQILSSSSFCEQEIRTRVVLIITTDCSLHNKLPVIVIRILNRPYQHVGQSKGNTQPEDIPGNMRLI